MGLWGAEADVRRHRCRKLESDTEREECRCGDMMNDIENYDEKLLIGGLKAFRKFLKLQVLRYSTLRRHSL